ncbi:hypothetical protein K432DRAFT_43872 [Lepidopterella palustris CBS 459.81]|uniref:Uncharacterized protein n=1 Tax=Lepidopterella palustris CBS 459.81 TaxID=1314670 RepID=A0A8E2EAV9_9PEZI|nr:hypothetical protein K432DRAFT_43872 [Lepidopterella palustris CBS 459.81]
MESEGLDLIIFSFLPVVFALIFRAKALACTFRLFLSKCRTSRNFCPWFRRDTFRELQSSQENLAVNLSTPIRHMTLPNRPLNAPIFYNEPFHDGEALCCSISTVLTISIPRFSSSNLSSPAKVWLRYWPFPNGASSNGASVACSVLTATFGPEGIMMCSSLSFTAPTTLPDCAAMEFVVLPRRSLRPLLPL